jgi:hypothetical protein
MGILLAGYLPGEDKQGLSALEAQLLAEPDREVIVVGRLVQHSLTEPRGPGSEERDVTLTLKWAALEAVAAGDEQTIASLIGSTAAARKAQDELHFGEDDVPGQPTGQAARSTGRGRRGRRGLSSVPAT